MLSIADEDGWVQILDTRKNGKRSIIKGIACNITLPQLFQKICLLYPGLNCFGSISTIFCCRMECP